MAIPPRTCPRNSRPAMPMLPAPPSIAELTRRQADVAGRRVFLTLDPRSAARLVGARGSSRCTGGRRRYHPSPTCVAFLLPFWISDFLGCLAQGFFTPSLRKKYSASLTAACERASAALRRGEKADEAVRIAIACLEDDATTNAGTGSNLTMDGVVECDACIVDGRHGDSGGVCSSLLRRFAEELDPS